MGLNNRYISIASIFVIAGLVIYQIQAQNAYEDEIALLRKSQTAALQINQDTVAQLQKTVAALNSQLLAAQMSSSNQGTNNAVAGNIVPAANARAGANQQQNMNEAIRTLMNAPAIKQMTSKMMVNATYGDFIRGLHLSASEKESLSQIFNNSMSEKAELQRRLAAGEISRAQYDEGLKNVDVKLRNLLSGYLYAEEMTAFDKYEVTKDARATARATQAREVDLERNVPALNPAARKYVAKIIADETDALRMNPSAVLASLQNPNGSGSLTQPLDNALNKIRNEGNLDKAQLSAVEDYVTQQKDMADSFSQFAQPRQGR